MIYDVNMKLGHLFENPRATEIFDRYLPHVRANVAGNNRATQLSVAQLVRYTHIPQGEALLAKLDEALRQLNTLENAISPREVALIQRFHQLLQQPKPEAAAPGVQDAFYPGKPWLDTAGHRIQAHGGAIYYEDGVYYWYGENKEHTDGKNGIWTWGIRVYASTDLYNWEDRGLLIPPELDDPNSSLFPTKRVDRPHLLHCKRTGKYVCWIKLSGPEAAFTIWQADQLLGPYTMVENLYQPGGHKVGDFDLIADESTGAGWLYFDADHTSMLCMRLSDDYLRAETEAAKSYPDLHPPFTREGPALFTVQGKRYMITSGMTGYVPNRSDSAIADAWDVPFVSLGDPHENDPSCASFNSQISKIFKVEGKQNLYIAMADRWLPEHPVDARLADLFTRVVGSRYEPEVYRATEAECQEMYETSLLETANTSLSEYVWLPVVVENGKPVIRWYDSWRLADFD